MKCKMCGTAFVPGENKFCEGCGMELPTDVATMSAPAQKSSLALDTDDVVPVSTSGPSNTVGRNSIQSSSNNTSNSNNITTTNTTVNNTTTTIEDDTKKSVVCAVSGKRVLYIDSACCKGCNKDVSLAYYNEKTRKCENCHQGYLQQYRDAFDEAMSSSGIDRQERSDLDILANSLQLTENEKLQIEQDIKNKYINKSNSDFSELDDLYELDFMDAKKDILIKNDLSSALLKLKQIYDQVQTNDEVSCLYFLIKALKNPTTYIANYEGKSFEDYWENYWYFLAQLTNGDKQRKGFSSFRQNHSKYSDKKDEIWLSEAMYFIVAYQNSNNESYIEKANEKLVEIDTISTNFLLKLYKSTKHIVLNFDPVDQKFTNLTPPDEPGMREYFIFFLNNLYKIAPEVPKVQVKTVLEPAIPDAPKLPELPVINTEATVVQVEGSIAQQTIPVSKPVTGPEPKKFPQLPNLPGGTNRTSPEPIGKPSNIPVQFPHTNVPTPNQETKKENTIANNGLKIPPLPTGKVNKPLIPGAKPSIPLPNKATPDNQMKSVPPIPQIKVPGNPAKPQIPTPQNKAPLPSPKVPGRPPMPPMPGKK